MTTADSGFKGDTPISSRFLLEIDGVQIGVFTEVSGLELKIEVESYREGGENGYSHQFPGRMSWPNITLKRGVTDSDALFTWMNKSAGEKFEANGNKLKKCTGAITIIDTTGKRERSWQLTQVFPVRWAGPSFNATSSDLVHEELEIAHDGFTSKTF